MRNFDEISGYGDEFEGDDQGQMETPVERAIREGRLIDDSHRIDSNLRAWCVEWSVKDMEPGGDVATSFFPDREQALALAERLHRQDFGWNIAVYEMAFYFCDFPGTPHFNGHWDNLDFQVYPGDFPAASATA